MQAQILAGALAGIELGAWDRRILSWLAGLDASHGADRRVVDRPFAGGRAGPVSAVTGLAGVSHRVSDIS